MTTWSPPSADRAATSPRTRLRIVVRTNPDKAGPIVGALRDAGHELVDDVGANGDVVLSDLHPSYGKIWELMERVGRTILYPHSAWPTLHCDGVYPVHPSVEAAFVVGEGSRQVLEAVGFSPPTDAVGWPYGELLPMRTTTPRRVLFGANHPDRLGHLALRQRIDNERIVDELVDGGFEVTVRHVGTLRQNGLQRRPGVRYHAAGRNGAGIARPPEDDLAEADVVVSCGTFAHRSLALGIPTVMCKQSEWMSDGLRPGQPGYLRQWSRYAHLLHFPYDADDDLAGTVRAAAADPGPAEEWRRRFLGEPFDPAAFVRRFEEVAG